MSAKSKTTAAKIAAAADKIAAAADTGTAADAAARGAILNAVLAVLDTVAGTYGDPGITSGLQRRRLQGAGIRRYGFITKTAEIAAAYPQYASGTFDLARLDRLISNIEDLRNISIAAEKLLTLVNDAVLVRADEAYALALDYYSMLREVARRNPAAKDVFDRLRPFFNRRTARDANAEPTNEQVLRDAAALLQGTKDGEVVVKNRRPRTPAPERLVIDDTEG